MANILLPALPLADYHIDSIESAITPALAIYLDLVDANIRTTLRLLNGDPDRWRPHVKTAKLAAVMSRLVESGVTNFKCATTLELLTACEVGARDVLVAYSNHGARAVRIKEIAAMFPKVRISVVVEALDEVSTWRHSGISAFIDVDPGMNRTGISQDCEEDIVRLAQGLQTEGVPFRGLHYYDGHHRNANLSEREQAAHHGYDHLLRIVGALQQHGLPVEEVITAGTPAFPASLTYSGFQRAEFKHRMSPGTVVYGDMSSLAQLPQEWGYQPAALVVSTVVSHPQADVFTCDAGHKSVSADAGIPNCSVVGHPEFEPLHPSEEHLPVRVPSGSARPSRGNILYLVPRHVCPTVNNFDHALIIRDHRIVEVAPVTARGREVPLAENFQQQLRT
ncbi:D-TA family PLP-dependent enzyme [Candidatus Korobacter versatilis]|nr:D-TA family PLP-dependent enzyme [Candidatus Koribacter versatilis]